MLGTNRDLETIRRLIDSEISVLKQIVPGDPQRDWASHRLTALGRQRLSVVAVQMNRRIEAAKKVVVLSRWLSGNGLLGGGAEAAEACAAPAPGTRQAIQPGTRQAIQDSP